ncbi:MAG: linear amide C-N hydrolase, partial [Lachnospiraceae bacterium]|nr:linear amide C-N hydrolase [Lachnospiraceae bacterium]
MKKRSISLFALLFAVSILTAGCGNTEQVQNKKESKVLQSDKEKEESTQKTMDTDIITPTSEIVSLEDDFATVHYAGDYKLDEFLEQGGAFSDADVMGFLTKHLFSGKSVLEFMGGVFGCSALSVKSTDGSYLFGRNFDWDSCQALVVSVEPEKGYASISTVNMDFIQAGAGIDLEKLPDEMKTMAALYAPLDGMNEKGLCVSVNMIEDSATIEQDTSKTDITTTTAVRLLLDQAADVDEALALLKQYDLHASMGMMVHFAIADAKGRSVAVEYVDDEMVVTDTPVVTNFYLAEGKKNGIGTEQSHLRYEILTERLNQNETMDMQDVRDALDRVSKDNFGEFESTEWSIVFHQGSGKVQYYHRENYEKAYTF